MKKILSLLAMKKAKIIAGVLAITLVAGGAVAISGVVSANQAWTAFLRFFGKASVTGNVWQPVLLDGGNYTGPNNDKREQSYTTSDIFAGETTRSIHELENRSSVEQKVKLTTSYSPKSIADYITTTYWKVLNYGETIDVAGSMPATVTVKDEGDKVSWTIDINMEGAAISNGHVAYALVISNDKVHPTFQVHDNDGTDSNYPWGTHLYSEWGPAGTGYNGWHTSDTNTPVSEIDWITASGRRDVNENPNGIFTVTINKDHLAPEFYWALQIMGDTFDTHYPEEWQVWTGDASTFATATLEERIWNGDITLQPNKTISFVMSNKTDSTLVCRGCTVTVTVKPR